MDHGSRYSSFFSSVISISFAIIRNEENESLLKTQMEMIVSDNPKLTKSQLVPTARPGVDSIQPKRRYRLKCVGGLFDRTGSFE